MNFWYKISQFMYGRYGVDKLFYGICIIAAIVSFVNIFVRSFILQLVVYLIIIYAFFRVISRNREARSKENAWFSNLIYNFKRKKETYRQRKADTMHIYKKCPNCRAILRLPRRQGKHTTVCPKCNTSFKVIVRK